jgi:protein-L-isoaspartate(D-aspartate) O-methyltransferase
MKTIRMTPNYFFRQVAVVFLPVLIFTFCSSAQQDSANKNKSMETGYYQDELRWKLEAGNMVKNQLISRGITDQNVLRVMRNTPRHLFVPEDMAIAAYYDGPLPIGEGQTISQPYIVALMTELLELKGHEKVLEIGTGSGYQAAVLSQLVDTCYTIELVKTLADDASVRLKQLGYTNVIAKCGDGYKGWPEHAPFDRIIVTAAPPEIPEKLIEQMTPDGKMVIPVGKYYQELIVVTRTKRGINREQIIPVRFVPMVKPDASTRP